MCGRGFGCHRNVLAGPVYQPGRLFRSGAVADRRQEAAEDILRRGGIRRDAARTSLAARSCTPCCASVSPHVTKRRRPLQQTGRPSLAGCAGGSDWRRPCPSAAALSAPRPWHVRIPWLSFAKLMPVLGQHSRPLLKADAPPRGVRSPVEAPVIERRLLGCCTAGAERLSDDQFGPGATSLSLLVPPRSLAGCEVLTHAEVGSVRAFRPCRGPVRDRAKLGASSLKLQAGQSD